MVPPHILCQKRPGLWCLGPRYTMATLYLNVYIYSLLNDFAQRRSMHSSDKLLRTYTTYIYNWMRSLSVLNSIYTGLETNQDLSYPRWQQD